MVDNWLPNFDMNEQMKVDKHIPENLARISKDFLIFPLTFRFLGDYHVSSEVSNMVTLQSYISALLTMSLALGVVFEIPVLSWLFAKLGFLSSSFMRKYRRHAVVLILIVAAVITPTSDVLPSCWWPCPCGCSTRQAY